jgi:predicted GH43/DUF377 family glycosyl hydrolase
MKINQITDIFPNSGAARYNLAAWQSFHTNSLYFIGREVEKPGELGQPDTGILKLFEVDNNGVVIQEKVIWKPIYDGINLEDPRVLETDQENLIIGLTAVLRNKNGQPVPFPAIVKIDSLNSWKHELPPILIIDSFGPGKNITPIDPNTFLFRPDSEDYNHKLVVFSLVSQIPKKLDEVAFPLDLKWATWKMGTTTSPIWINPNEALFIIHGITIQKIDGVDKYIYSIGRAKLTRKDGKFEVMVAPEPILTPDNFLDQNGIPIVEELHPNLRRVIYSCGGIIKNHSPDELSLFVNVGDRKTFEVEFSLEELKKDLF